MANVTLSIDEDLLRRGREYASKRGTSLNALIRRLISDLTAENETAVEALIGGLKASPGASEGRSWSRDELHDRSV